MNHFEAFGVVRVFRSGARGDVRALDGVDLDVPRGAFAAITGPSGCGKTTLLALLGALDRPTEGTVAFDGRDLRRASEGERSRVRRRIGIVFQQSPLIRGLPLWENVSYPLVPLGRRGRERRRAAEHLLDRVGLGGMADARPEELSGGEQQRAGLARALVADPEAILADEPTSNLDADTALAVLDLLRTLHAEGRTVVCATHDPALAAMATQTCTLRDGRVA